MNDESDGLEEELRDRLEKAGFPTLNAKEFFRGLNETYGKPSLTSIVEEEIPQIIEHSPSFFEEYEIELPQNLEVYLFDQYYSTHGEKGLKRVYHSAKVWFGYLRFFLIDHPDKKELANSISKFKKILDGKYFESSEASQNY